MTKYEAIATAIATLEAIKQFGIGKWMFDKEEIEAFDMAIEALEKEEPPIIFRVNTLLQPEEMQEIKRKLREEIPNAVVIPNNLEPVAMPLSIGRKPGTPQIGDEVMVQGVLSLIERDGDGTMDVELKNVKAIMKV